MRYIFLVVNLFFLTVLSGAQNRPGTWLDYASYSRGIKTADAGNRCYCSTEGGLFYVDKTDNSINKMSTKDGLSDVEIQTMAWNEQKKLLLIAYKNCNIDLVSGSKIVNLSDIKRKLISGDKTVYNILFHGNNAFLACGFGIVEINLEKEEIKGTYIIGESGEQIKVFDVETNGNLLYAATEKGIMVADINHPNLLDYRNWSKESSVPHSTGKFSQLAMINGKLMAVYSPDQYSGDEAYLYNNNQWSRILPEVTYYYDLTVNTSYLTATSREEVFIYDLSLKLLGRINDYKLGTETVKPIQSRSAFTSVDGIIWIADFAKGLIRLTGQQYEQNLPAGPMNNDVFSLTTFQNELWIAAGGRTDPWNNQYKQPVFQHYYEESWSFFTVKEVPEMTGFWDIVQIAVDPRNREHIFIASWGGGILEFKNSKYITRYNNLNSPLQTALPETPLEPYTRIGGIAFDGEGTLWITNAHSTRGLHSLNAKGEWKSYELPEFSGQQYTIGQIIVNRYNDKWIVIPRGRDLYVVNKNGNDVKYLPVTSYFSNGEQEIFNRMNDVYSIVEDLTGEIWVGTSKGVAVFSNPGRIWQETSFYAYQPSLDLKDGLYHPLLETETVTAMVVDGANRKWLGTRNSGIYLVSEQGDQEILHFTKDNSPLPSNTIICLAFNDLTGVLFIGTDKGLVSYQGDAPLGNNDYSQVYVYPNPVRETYSGDITVAGLKAESDVRITDIAGNLVFKGTSLGSKIIWDGNNLNGNRASTGVYLVFCADASGEETHIAKLLFIH
jgi:sugar lactone lactonase YvrE